MPDRVASRIAAAFVAVGLVAVLAVGGGLFVSLRSLHHQAALATLGDIAQPVAARVRQTGTVADLQHELSVTAPGLRAEIGVYELINGRVVPIRPSPQAVDVSSVAIDPSLTPGETKDGELSAVDGTRILASLTLVRAQGALVGPAAILLTLPDTSGAEALRDLLRVMPIVLLITAGVAIPTAWALSRSITKPLRRLADATAALPAVSPAPVPPEGPREVRELTDRFNATTAELERVRLEERDLLASVRHDLRTPLTVVSGFAEALRDGTASGPGVARAGDAIAQEAARMERLVDDLRSIDELRAGRIGIRPEPLDPHALVAEAAARFGPQAEAAGVALTAAADPGLALMADRAAVERMLGNLVANALGHLSRGGRVLVEARSGVGPAISGAVGGPVTMAGTWVALRVSDDGPGFPPGSLERVFDRFYRADPSRAGGNSGLGLSIVRAFAEAHGGQAFAENLAPSGARVTVLLPAGGAPPTPGPPRAPIAAPVDPAPTAGA